MADDTCKEVLDDGTSCPNPSLTRGYCSTHYQRRRRSGTLPPKILRPQPSIVGSDALIPLTRGLVAIVDAADLHLVGARPWHAKAGGRTWYAATTGPIHGRGELLMHRIIMGLGHGDPHVDHRDGDGLNNRRSNLRVADCAQNGANQRKQRGRSSRYKGVSWYRQTEKWRAYVQADGRERHLGYFKDEAEAARAYDAAATEVYGDFAKTNFPLVP